ncbi:MULTISPECIES: DUF4307 domain-containing protein [Brachybacterium]|uniref:DUF4307 domain-containing protein n=1 Tax=Brachybacterium TaxID=43668 RepID=UPI000BB989E7|nr:MULTISPECIES: DUF4307 domain-containing protein [Brachybacterium]PCC31673.1 hypothetical protein CIK71_13790 [Brachybacterium alimentarium]RCS64545.1 DUF4307 domain-containing protein [Brachybacterium sp. JB7]RCS65384.1 DUF4307 domain-containing protein [Brachybacterium alimentarium]RCS75401.1 DUF4307 domain-containing protein [Brachybacterium alimentarium]RCS80247.1 DUF4307 domain-containing protein [Brachybacterium alimentarium]
MNGTQQRSAERYGAPRISKRTARVLIAVAAAVFVAVVALVGYWSVSAPIRAEMVGYDHVADDVIAVDYQLTMKPGTEATCRIQALNSGRAQVGFVETHVPAQSSRHSVQRVEISTQGAAVSAEVLGCDPA